MMRVCLGACVLLSLVAVSGCGPKVPKGNGYKTKSPWKKTKPLNLAADPSGIFGGKVKGSLSYAELKRAKWYTLDLTEDGDLNLALSFSPTDAAGDTTVAMEVLDKDYNVISEDPDAPLKATKHSDDDDDDDSADSDDDSGDDDEEDSGDDSESDTTQKTRAIDALKPGRYYVHLFLTKRMDQADFELNATFTGVPPTPESHYPKDVAWLPDLPQVPVADDAPAPNTTTTTTTKPCKGKKCHHHTTTTTTTVVTPPPDGATTVYADIVAADDDPSGGTNITINAGTADGLSVGRKGSLKGVKNGSFSLSSCKAHSCSAHLKASVEEVKHSSMSVKLP